MATSGDTVALTEDELDQLKLPKAVSLCKQLGIDLSSKPKLHTMRWLLKYELLCKETNRKEAIAGLDRNADIDEGRRAALTEIYDNTIDNVQTIMQMEDPVVEELKRIFPNCCESLEEEKQHITNSQAPVLVLGETGSGKSSFINLLLGQNILPCSMLSNTHVVCEIMYSRDEQSYAILFPVDKEHYDVKKITDDGDGKAFRDELAKLVQAMDNGKPIYQKAMIYLPCDILKSGLVIVDSPGIGETKHMENMVLEYILNACTFIYIIDTTSAGGMQARMQKLVEKVYRKALEEQREYRPESAIFICNKWDGVPYIERNEVWQDTVAKITKQWPFCKESQVFKFSTLEAAFIQEKGGLSPNFTLIMREINKLVPLGREILVLRGYRFLEYFAKRCIHCFGAHLRQIELSQEGRMKKQQDTTDRLRTLKSNINSFFDEQFKLVKADISEIAENLKVFITQQGNMEDVCKFSENDLPRGRREWKEVAVAVRAHVYSKLMILIRKWEEDKQQFKSIGVKISNELEAQFPKFNAEIYLAQKEMSSSRTSQSATLLEDEDEDLVPHFIKSKFEGLNFGMRVAVGIGLSPVLVVGMAVRLPVYGFKTLKRAIKTLWLETEYRKAENDKEELRKVCEKYARSTVESITDKLKLEQIISDDIQPLYNYIRMQRQRMENQIQSDLDLLEELKLEARSDIDIRRTYEPLYAKFRILKIRLKHFLFVYLPTQNSCGVRVTEIPFHILTTSDNTICTGLEAQVFAAKSAESEMTGGFTDVCVRRIKGKITPSTVKKYIKVQIAYSIIHKPTIVKCLGIATDKANMYQVLEPLQCSLRSYLPNLEVYRTNRINTIIQIMKNMVDGLKFLHEKSPKLVHFDLSMDTVAVDLEGKIKLTNIKNERTKVNIQPEMDGHKIKLGSYIHIAPKFFLNNSREEYCAKDDMFGVGVIMWELWVGQPLVDLEKEYEIPVTKPKHYQETPAANLEQDDEPSGSETEIDPDMFRSFLEDHQPKREPHFVVNDNDQEMRFITPHQWWTKIEQCLKGEITSEQWFKHFQAVAAYPDMTIVENHFER